MAEEYSHLRKSNFFKDLQDQTFQQLFAQGNIKRFQRGEFVLHFMDENIPVLFVLKGLLEILRSAENGREQVIDLARMGDGINLIPTLLQEQGNRSSVRAVSPADVLSISPPRFTNLLATHLDLSQAVNLLLARRLAHMTGLVESLALAPVRARLARFLMLQAEQKSPVTWTQDEIARQIGSVRDVVGRTLRTFELNGLISINRNRIVLRDREGLEAETKAP